jgi:hypothetical protein
MATAAIAPLFHARQTLERVHESKATARDPGVASIPTLLCLVGIASVRSPRLVL